MTVIMCAPRRDRASKGSAWHLTTCDESERQLADVNPVVPGERLPTPYVVWDMNACHTYYGDSLGHAGTQGSIPVGAHVLEGEPSAP
jgi:hypothetical protein